MIVIAAPGLNTIIKNGQKIAATIRNSVTVMIHVNIKYLRLYHHPVRCSISFKGVTSASFVGSSVISLFMDFSGDKVRNLE